MFAIYGREKTISVDTNRRAGWFYSYDGQKIQLHQLSDPYTNQHLLEAGPMPAITGKM